MDFLERAKSTYNAMPKLVVASSVANATVLFGATASAMLIRDAWDTRCPAPPYAPPQQAAAPYTVMLFTTLAQLAVFAVVLAVWGVCTRPAMQFVLAKRNWAYFLFAGVAAGVTMLLVTFSSAYTHEVYKSMTAASIPGWICLFSTLTAPGPRRRSCCAFSVVAAVVLCVGGAALGGMSSQGEVEHSGYAQVKWACFYALSAIPAAVYLTLAAGYMAGCATPRLAVDRVFDDSAVMVRRSDGLTAKLVFLVAVSFFQLLALLAMFPLAWTPYFGGANNADEATSNIREDFRCIFFGCTNQNWLYAVLYVAATSGMLLSGLFVSRYSAPLAGIMQMLGRPTAALVMLAVPAWTSAVSDYRFSGAAWEYVLSFLVISLAGVVFLLWELATSSVSTVVDTNVARGQGMTDTSPLTDHRNMQYMYASTSF